MISMRHILRTKIFWAIFVILNVLSIGFVWHYFPLAFPIIHLNITMDRAKAQMEASKLADKFNWGPKDYQQAVNFDEDTEAKHFIELEGGGKEKLTEILEEHYYTPYRWQVRHFKEYETLETFIYFTPDGKFYGFEQKIPETLLGAALTADQARTIAETVATSSWNIDLKVYKLIESSNEKKPNGRVDHTFSYERTDKQVGEGRYRLKLVVSGDQLTELSLFLKVPEAFSRRYEHMRSANNTIAFAATVAMAILYIFIGCILGLAYLYRRNWLVWRPALLWALLLAFLETANNINYLPLRWMYYDTAVTKMSFFANLLISLCMIFIGYTVFLTLIIIVAEGLTRAAFGNQPQLWKVWKPNAASSIQILGRTAGGYLIVGLDMLYVVSVYLFASRYLGWWSPSETLLNPNVLASYAPWLSAISHSINAGFMEECLFRAIPLAGAYLIGKRYGKENLFLAIAFIIQAIIFGAAHANYPAQPAYARLLELIIPSFIFATLYLRFGLLTSIISHFIYDVVWFALPLFIAATPGIWIDRVAVIAVSLIPIWIIMHARMKIGYWAELADIFYNRAWLPVEMPPREIKAIIYEIKPRNKIVIFSSLLIGIAGLILWGLTTSFKQDNLPLTQTKKEAAAQANQFLTKRDITLTPTYLQLTSIEAELNDQHKFIWRTQGRDAYHALIGNYLLPASWKFRYAQFEGDVTERAETYVVHIDGKGTIHQFEHQLPEKRPGKTLTESEAGTIVHDFIKSWYSLNPTELSEISAVSNKMPDRLDWTFTFSQPTAYPLKDGQARIEVKVAGNEISEFNKYIFVPEEWQRKVKEQDSLLAIIKMICQIIFTLLMLAASLYVIRNWHLFQFSIQLFFIWFGIIASCIIINNTLSYEQFIAEFSTAQPFHNQISMLLGKLALSILLLSIFFTSAASLVTSARVYLHTHHSWFDRISLSFGLGTIVAAVDAGIIYFLPHIQPEWADYTQAASYFPALSLVASTVVHFILNTTFFMMFIIALDYIRNGKQRPEWISMMLSLIFGLLLYCMQNPESIIHIAIGGIISGIVFYILYYFVLRFDRTLAPGIIVIMYLLQIAQQIAFNAWPGVVPGAIAGGILIIMLAVWWMQMIEKSQRFAIS